MKKISIIGLSFLSVLAIATFVFFQSCNTDECKDVVCLNGGVCIAGTCSCDTGYEGDDCSTLSRAKFIGTFDVTENCSGGGGPYNYGVEITGSSSDDTKILIKNLGNYNCSGGTDYYVEGVMTSSTTFSINHLNATCATTFTTTSDASISSDENTITISYHATDGGSIDDNCTAVLVRQ